jgi:hypothetical protein
MTTPVAEWHYLNSTSAPLQDRSSVAVCTVPTGSRPKTASITFRNTTSNAIGWGDPFTGGEMCYGFVVHYPAHSLDNGTRSLLGASSSCL